MSSIIKFIKDLSYGIRTKMLISVSIIVIFSISFMSYFAVATYGKKLSLNSTNLSNQSLGILVRNLDNYIDDLIDVSSTISYNNFLQNYLLGIKNSNKGSETSIEDNYITSSQNFQMSLGMLGDIVYTRKDISSILIITNNHLSLYKSSNIDVDTTLNFSNQDWYLAALKTADSPVITGPRFQKYIKSNPEKVFSVSRTIQSYDGKAYKGVMLVDANLSIVDAYCDSVKPPNNGFILITDDNGDIVYNSSDSLKKAAKVRSFIKNILPTISHAENGNLTEKLDNEDCQIVFKHMNSSPWIVSIVTPYKNIVADANNIKNLIITVGLICLIFILILTYLISSRITKPIVSLKEYMDQANHGNFNIRALINSNDEVGMLAGSFNNMIERIQFLMNQVVKEQESKRKLELKALQHQINPHFLYNTLDSIIWMAESKDENIVPMTEALSKLFRISLNGGQEYISLSQELEHVRNYLFIQSMRYLNKYDYNISCDASLSNCKTLKLILQPLVENSIYHGIKNKPGKGIINIQAYEEGGKLVFSIKDNGIGMDAEKIESIFNGTHSSASKKGKSLGVRNVEERIELTFGSEYGISFESTPGEGTTAYIFLPLLPM